MEFKHLSHGKTYICNEEIKEFIVVMTEQLYVPHIIYMHYF